MSDIGPFLAPELSPTWRCLLHDVSGVLSDDSLERHQDDEEHPLEMRVRRA